MIIYEVYDGDEHRAYFSSKAKAIKDARKCNLTWSKEIVVVQLDLGKIDQAKGIALLEGGGYAESQSTVFRRAKP